jgi:ACT domain-containing protein
MKAVVSVIGTDKRGIIAKVATALWEMNINVEDISQTIMQQYFTMIMLVDLSEADRKFVEVADRLKQTGEDIGVEIKIQSESIFYAMHRI